MLVQQPDQRTVTAATNKLDILNRHSFAFIRSQHQGAQTDPFFMSGQQVGTDKPFQTAM
ncbi:hypothetical protein D3C73_1600670 [compost metagenome]